MPLLSVIVPVYNVREYLEACIESIVRQTYGNLDIILVDDGSKNGEAEICDRYAATDDRIRVVHKENAGLVAARKTGVGAARGEYITFVDGDDYIEPDYYERMMGRMLSDNPDIVSVGIKKEYSEGTAEVLTQPIGNGVYEKSSLQWLLRNMNSVGGHFYNPGVFPSTCTKIYKKAILSEILTEVPERITMGEDAAIAYPYLLKCSKVAIDNDISGYVYRINPDNMTSTFGMLYFDGISSLYEHLTPFYANARDDAVAGQLDVYRAYLLYLGINNIMSVARGKEIFKLSRLIADKARELTIFNDAEGMLAVDIPRSLTVYLKLLNRAAWRMFGLIWLVRNVRNR